MERYGPGKRHQPENGTVTYTYDGAHHVLSRTDAKKQVTGYSYDAYGRLSAVAHYPTGVANGADPSQQVNYYYDTNPYNDPIASNTWGRLAAVAFGNDCPQGAFNATTGYVYMYGYNQAGRVTGQKMRVNVNQSGNPNYTCAPDTVDQTASYGWDTEGRMTSLTYPGSTNALTYTYNVMGQLAGKSDSVTGTAASATYGTAGEIDSLAYPAGCGGQSISFGYNSLWQLTAMNSGTGCGPLMAVQYVYPAGQNNGRISQSIDGVLNQTVNYTYDSLSRLATAAATDGSWGDAYSYDGFGNLTAKTVTAGSAPYFSASYNAANQGAGSYDANGNPILYNGQALAYDVENRLLNSIDGSTSYGYDPQGKRVLRETLISPGPNPPFTGAYNSEFTFYGVTGQRLNTFSVQSSNYNSGYCSGYKYCTFGPNA